MEFIMYLVILILAIAIAVMGIMLFLGLISGALGVGTIGGVAVGIYYGCRNYFSSLRDEIRLRK